MRRAVAVAIAALTLLSVGVAPAAAGSADEAKASNPCVGTIREPANGMTLISVQGMRMGPDGGKRKARIVAVGPNGSVEWVHRRKGVVWGYDIDPMGDGYVFVTATVNVDNGDDDGETVFYKLDARTGKIVWEETVDMLDTHDADYLGDGKILIANMRNYNETTGENEDRLAIYNRTTDEIVWEWEFADHYNRSIGGKYEDDWTHVNDVDRVSEGRYLASPRNFDKVVLVNRTSGDVELELGVDDDYSILNEQHNPVYLEGEDGTPTFLVADSGNDRIVEYRKTADGWEKTWEVGSKSSLAWPRDADRLPDGDTLIADSVNNRVIEVAPNGTVVWEFYAPWLIYDVERVPYGDEAGGPTIAEQNATGDYRINGSANFSTKEVEECADYLANVENDWPGRAGNDGGPPSNPGEAAKTVSDIANDRPIAFWLGLGAAVVVVGVAAVAGLRRVRD